MNLHEINILEDLKSAVNLFCPKKRIHSTCINSDNIRILLNSLNNGLTRKKILVKLKTKNKGNIPLVTEIDELIKKIEASAWKSKEEIQAARPDADQVHSDGFYFFDINVHRTLILVEFDDDSEAKWFGPVPIKSMKALLRTIRRSLRNG